MYMPTNSHWRCSVKKSVLRDFAIFTGKYMCASLYLKKFFQQRYFPVNVAKFLSTLILKNTCERLLRNVAFNSNGSQHMLVKLDEMKRDIIMPYIYWYHSVLLYYFCILFYPEPFVWRCPPKRFS